MLASAMALAAIVVSDIAEAREHRVEEADDVSEATPVTMKKVQVKVEAPIPVLVEPLEVTKQPRKPRKSINFGRFEGY